MKSNDSIFDLKYKIAVDRNNILWKQLQLKELENQKTCLNKTFEEIDYDFEKTLVFVKLLSPANHSLLNENKQLTPEAKKAFINIFKRF